MRAILNKRPINRTTEGLCAVCRRMDCGRAVKRGGSYYWACSDPECLEILDRSTGMKQSEFNKLEAEAAIEGGRDMGRFLDEKGFGDLFENMPPEVWAEGVMRAVSGYRTNLKKLIDDETIPF